MSSENLQRYIVINHEWGTDGNLSYFPWVKGKDLLIQGTECLMSFSSWIPFWVHCWWSTAVDYNSTLVELS